MMSNQIFIYFAVIKLTTQNVESLFLSHNFTQRWLNNMRSPQVHCSLWWQLLPRRVNLMYFYTSRVWFTLSLIETHFRWIRRYVLKNSNHWGCRANRFCRSKTLNRNWKYPWIEYLISTLLFCFKAVEFIQHGACVRNGMSSKESLDSLWVKLFYWTFYDISGEETWLECNKLR